MEPNAGPECVACRGGRDDRDHSCVYCHGHGRVQSLEQWVAAGKPKTTKRSSGGVYGIRTPLR